VALARAVVNRPQLLLLDEPLGALDLKLRRQMQLELKRIQTEVGITFVHVTHDQEEAMTMADTVAVMNQGRIEQLGDPVELYEFPKTVFVANFLGQSNLLPGRRSGSGNPLPVAVHGQTVLVPADRCRTSETDLLIGIRPEKLHLTPVPPDGSPGVDRRGDAPNVLTGGVVGDVSFSGVSTQYTVRMPWEQDLTVFAQNRGAGGLIAAGTPVTLSWEPEHTFALRHEAGAAPAAG
jgi:spermidine/putrescine transport system ATP-binding protein